MKFLPCDEDSQIYSLKLYPGPVFYNYREIKKRDRLLPNNSRGNNI